MRPTEAYANLLQLKRPVVSTGEAAARLELSEHATSKLLRRLVSDGLVIRLRRGLWALISPLDPYTLPPYLTAPYPSYISTWTALYYHGMIDQVPRDVYVVSLDRSKTIKTPVGTFIVQHLDPVLFEGFVSRDGIHMATPEKALFDTQYLAGVRGRSYTRLPEVDLPENFDEVQIRKWVQRISLPRLRMLVEQRIGRALDTAREPAPRT